MTRIDIGIEDQAWNRALPNARRLARRAALAAARLAEGGSISVLLTDAEAVRNLNARFLRRDEETNVLAFPSTPNGDGHLGDVALAFDVCAREALAQRKPLGDHLQHLVIHGVLHLLGYDHDAEAPAVRMEALERGMLARLGVPDPYQRAEDHQHVR